jgi:FkbM family methyltransferase
MLSFLKRCSIVLGALYLRQTSCEKGRYRLITILLPWLRQLGAGMGKRLVRTRYGYSIEADLSDWLGQYVYLTGMYEPPTADLFKYLINTGDTVLDVGANIGFFSLLSATLTGTSGQVIAFEPIPSVRAALISNIKLNNFKQVEVVDKAVSDKSASLTIYEGPEEHKGISSLRPIESASNKLTIEAVALDDIASHIEKVNFIKIDVEGAEMKALLGMEELVQETPFI